MDGEGDAGGVHQGEVAVEGLPAKAEDGAVEWGEEFGGCVGLQSEQDGGECALFGLESGVGVVG